MINGNYDLHVINCSVEMVCSLRLAYYVLVTLASLSYDTYPVALLTAVLKTKLCHIFYCNFNLLICKLCFSLNCAAINVQG